MLNSMVHLEVVSSIVLAVPSVLKYDILFYHWSVFLLKWYISPRTL